MNIKYILILFFISIQFTNAQVAKNNKLYASSELSIGNYLGKKDLGMINEYKKAWEKRIERLGLDIEKLENQHQKNNKNLHQHVHLII